MAALYRTRSIRSKVSSLRFCARLRLRPLLLRAGSLIALAALSGCDVPTELPIIEVRWVFPIEDKSISVTELLPPSGDVTISGGNFQVNVAPYTVTQTLGDFCPLCAAIDGFTVPKPPFNFTYNDSGGLPTDVVSVEVVSGSIFLGIQNDLGFDPIRPAVADPGTLTVTLYDGDIAGRVLGQAVLAGATDSLPDGSLTTIPLTLAPGTVTSTIFTVIDLDSPLGDTNVLIDITASFDITVTVGSILVSSATIDVDGRAVSIPETTLDVAGIDADLVANIQSGSLLLDVQNPFGVAIDIVVEIGGVGITTLQRNLNIGSGATTSATLSYTGADLQSFLGKTGVFFRGSGTVTSPGVPATVTPTQVASIAASLDVVLELGR